MNNINIIKPAIVEAGSTAAQILVFRGLQNLRQSFYQVSDPIGQSDSPDLILSSQQSNYLLNKNVFDTVTLCGNGANGDLSYYDLTTQQIVTVPKMQIPIALINVSKKNIIVKTKVAGRNGTVKQYISLDDYDISINGVFTTGIIDTFPKAAMKQLQAITSCTTEVKVYSNYLSIFGISYLVFETCEFPQNEDTGRDEQHFTLNCISETSYTINANQQGGTNTTIFNNFNGTVSAAPAPTTA